ncbi:hypothetical protein DQ226_08390 [Dietzia maris]|jgi:hypothetical protein|uniref:Single-stranded DNA-binding protein n=2 Tax=Actinomycetes TaxID=1760 RepID=A0A365PA91_9ACTN|nr:MULTISPECIES: hypothetical protein [Dietzia]MCT2140911.1 hypothetical protein [Dietzia cinnamea]MCY1655717.1 hypothetical protein [Dietzia sp. SL131]RBA36796.1 hypothetical protein DQ226_08390 [Dietzia maris]GLB65103.1 hypothetical protein NCCP2495_29830 [Dietzia sp. NCCP-2495]
MVIDGNVIEIGTLNQLKSGSNVLTIKVLHRAYNPTARKFTGQVVYDVELRKQLAENAHASLTIGDDVIIDADEHDLAATIYTDSNGQDHPLLTGAKARNLGISIRSEALPVTP